jgi:hypothetical protein
LTPASIIYINHEEEEEEEDKIYDNIISIDQEEIEQESPPIHDFQSDIYEDQSRTHSLTEIDENDFLYEEPSLYAAVGAVSPIPPDELEEQTTSSSSYKIDEYVDEDDSDERDHVKELEETIANLSRHFPSSTIESEEIRMNSPSILTMNNIDTDSILEMEIESPTADDISSPLSLAISVPTPINNRRGSLSRSSGVRENLTDLLITAANNSQTSDNQLLQRTLSTHRKVINNKGLIM